MALSGEAVAQRTGRTLAEWFKLLDKWGAAERTHKEIAAYLAQERKVEDWWAQGITVEYERARGRRALGQRADGHYEVSAQRKVVLAPMDVEAALADLDPALAAPPRASETKQGRVLRFASDEERVEVVLSPAPGGGCVVRVTQGGLPSMEAREDAKKRWKAALDKLGEQ